MKSRPYHSQHPYFVPTTCILCQSWMERNLPMRTLPARIRNTHQEIALGFRRPLNLLYPGTPKGLFSQLPHAPHLVPPLQQASAPYTWLLRMLVLLKKKWFGLAGQGLEFRVYNINDRFSGRTRSIQASQVCGIAQAIIQGLMPFKTSTNVNCGNSSSDRYDLSLGIDFISLMLSSSLNLITCLIKKSGPNILLQKVGC